MRKRSRRIPLVVVLATALTLSVGLGLATATGNNGPLTHHHNHKSLKDDVGDGGNGKDFKFTEPSYNASVPENSLASTLVLPYTEEQLDPSGHPKGPQRKMGVWNPSKLDVAYSIIDGDKYNMFRAESLQVGDFNFLILRVSNRERILNREFKELYKLHIKAELFGRVEKYDNVSLAKASALLGNEIFDETDDIQQVTTTTPAPTTTATTEKLFIISEDLISPEDEDVQAKDPFSLGVPQQPSAKKIKRRTKQKREKGLSESTARRRGRDNKEREGPLKRTSRDEKLKSSFTSGGNPSNTNVTRGTGRTSKGRGSGGRRNRNRGGNKPTSQENVNEIKVDEDKEVFKSVTVRTTNANSKNVPNSKRVTMSVAVTTTPSTTTTSTTPKPRRVLNIEDGGKRRGVVISTAFCTVALRVLDSDDNQPVFESSTYDIGVNEDAPVLSRISKITASDPDIGRNSEVYYSLAEWNDDWCIDPITGSISATRPLLGRSKDRDRESIRVRARNRWNTAPNSGSIATVNIHVRPVNRYAPQIRINRPPQVEIRPYGVIYAVVSIRDADEGENGVADLEIKEGDPNGIFRVTPTSSRNEFYVEMSNIVATSMATNMARGERSHQFNLTLKATDRGTPSKSTEKDLQVRVADALWGAEKGTNTAIFDKDVYEVEISETSPPHSVVFRLKRPDSAVGLSISSGNDGDDFVLEEKSGVLYTNKFLDAESKSTYTLTIDSHDMRTSQRTFGDIYRRRQSVAKVIIKVLDGNDNSPEWEALPNNRSVFNVLENEAVGTKVIRLHAKDTDSGENGYVTYSIANLKPTPFTIDHFTGDIRTGRLLDYEIDRKEYTLRVVASDWGQPTRRQTEQVIRVKLQDQNDNRPLFTVKECVAVIDRAIKFDTEISPKLEALDFDREDLVTYRIVGGNEDGCFNMDSVSGKIKVVCDLRDIRVPKRYINVTATDGEYYSDIMSVKVELGDGRVNNLRVNRTSGSDASVRTGIKLFSTSHSVFECEDTGVKDKSEHMLAVSEKNNQAEQDFPPLSSRYRENSHTPVLPDLPKEISVFENATVGTTLLRLKGRDLDKGYNGLLTFVISGGDEAHGAWDIVNPTPIPGVDGEPEDARLIVAAPLDRESVPSYILNISVWDQGKPPKMSSKMLYIKVKDSNDNPPIFTKSAMKLKIGEGSELVGEQLIAVSAFDEDEEGTPNSLISYRLLTPSRDFSIDDKLGTIRLLRELDRERQDRYELLVVAEDHGFPKLSSICLLSVIVDDRNDCPPKFEPFASSTNSGSNSRVVTVTEDWPVGGVVTQIVARDDDLGLGGKVRYSLVSEEEDFFLDEISGVLRIKRELDYETTSIYNLTIRARDLGHPSLSTDTSIVIEVMDVLESSPTVSFTEIAREATVSEAARVGTLITKMGVSPSDALENVASLTLEGPTRYLFNIDQSGSLRTAHALDFETHPTHWLTVLAKSSTTSKTLALTNVFVSVTDFNECVPLTTEPSYRVQMPENTPSGYVFLKLDAFDCDPGGRLTYSIKSSTPYFDIDPLTGELETTDLVLDREKQPVHTFDVVVSDSGTPSLNSSASVTVILIDENDNSPKFLHKRGIHNIPELNGDLQGDQPLGKKGSESESSRSEEDEEEDEEEDINEEEMKWSDWNVMEEQKDMISEGNGWKKIFRLVAFDNDEGRNGTVTYKLKYRVSTNVNQVGVDNLPQPIKEDETYSINPTTGEIFTSAPSLKENTMLKFIVEASDNGLPEAKVTETILMLRVKGFNRQKSQPPQILMEDDSLVQLTTKERPGYTVETVDAVDPEGEQLWYEIVSGDPEQYFVMWPESQNLILAKTIPSPMELKLNISVSDGMSPVFVQLRVKVVDSEDHSALVWSQTNYSALITGPNNGDEGVIATVKINSTISLTSPEDVHSPGTILYGFHNAQDARSLQTFSIDTITGEVSLTKGSSVEREALSSHILTIKARNPTNSYGYVRLSIETEEKNEFSPVFYSADGRYPRIELRVPETTAVGSRIAQILAYDIDEGEAGMLAYSITFGNIGNTFAIDKDSGWLSLQRPLGHFSSQPEYQLTVQAMDAGTPPLSSTTSVTIIATPPNDDDLLELDCRGDDEVNFGRGLSHSENKRNGQRKTVMRVRVKENSPQGTYVTTIKAKNSNSASVSFELEDNRNNIFWIDPSTGVVLVGKGHFLLDRETKPSLEITVKGTNARWASSQCRLVCDLLDTNDHRPIFTSAYYEGLIREDALPGTLVRKRPQAGGEFVGLDPYENEKRPLVLESTDLDVGLNALVTYSIIEEEEMRKVFHIDPSTGALLLVTSLDYEKRSGYVFHVKATDGGGLTSPSVATVNVSVENVNMKRPIVASAKVELLLPTAVGVLLHKISAHDPDGDELEFNITRGNEEEWFKLGKKSGEIRIGKLEDFTGKKIVLEVNVGDGKHWTSASITITPRNLEKNPVFYFKNSTFLTSTMENSTKLINLLSLEIVGAYINEPLQFKMLTPTKYFGLKPTSGVVYTTGEKLDREEQAKHQLLVQVRGEDPSRISRCLVTVLVQDKNDEVPRFLNLPYVAVVSLESKAGDTVLQMSSVDLDEGENAAIRYELVRSPHGDIYDLDRVSGQIRLRRKPDVVGQHELRVKIYDLGVPTNTAETTVLVKIVSRDQPIFEQQFYETWIPENAALQSTAIALMAHAHNSILYSIQSGNDNDEFAIDYQTDMGLNRICVLYVNSPLDFEKQQTHRLEIRATDLITSKYSTTSVLIKIRDSNDQRPVFEKPVYTIRLVEGYMPPNSILASVKAHDNDTGINAMLTYELVPDDGPILRLPQDKGGKRGRREIELEDMDMDVMEDATSNQRSWDVSRYFMVKPNDGTILLKQIVDYEQAHFFRFSIVVKDSGIPSLSSTARVVVQVVDINDSGVVVEKSSYYALISEMAPRGHFVTKISGYTPETVDNIKYAIVGHSYYHSPFDIDPETGVVTVAQPSLLFTELEFHLNISVTDGVFTSFAKLHVEIEARNHHPPQFSSLIYEVGCPENAQDGHLITTLRAEDPDRSIFGKIKYSIAQSDEPEMFEMDEDTGEVRFSGKDVSLDREAKGSHVLEIMAQDLGVWISYSRLYIKILDLNEYPPQFPVSEYRVTIPADRIRSKGPILSTHAVDPDTEFGIKYSIVDLPTTLSNRSSSTYGKRDSSFFEIQPETGEIRLRMSDQDVVKFMKENSRVDFQFWVGATDEGGLHQYIPVTVVLLPEGVPAPEIQPQNATFFVKEDAPIGSIITTFTVSTLESPRFTVVSNNEDNFQVDNHGNLMVKARLDQESEDKHTIVIWAEDSSQNIATAQVTVRVFKTAGRKRPPIFQSKEFKVKVAEDFPEGSLLFTLRPIDSDKANSIKERYALVPSKGGQESTLFSVNPEHGWITLVNKLDYELRREHVLHVLCSDYDKPFLQTTVTVIVTVMNVPDCPVSFDTTHYFSSVREDVPEGTVIATVRANDLDNAVKVGHGHDRESHGVSIVSKYLKYFIVDGNDEGHFKINERGEIQIWRGLDYEKDQKFELRIVATDGFFTDFCNASISVLDINDNSPICPMPEYNAQLSEGVATPTYVLTVEAFDPDFGSPSPRFSLAGDGSTDFVIDTEAGVVTTKAKLDREAKAFYNLVSYAEDKESGESCRMELFISILDENDNPPVFSEFSYTLNVKEDAPVGALIGKVHADDRDIGLNRRVKYALVSVLSSTSGESVIDDQFSLQENSGVISLLRPLDRELVPGYNLTIKATDGGIPQLSSNIDVIIYVSDVNDNPPEFAFNYYSSTISELAPISSEITRVLATSKDVGVNAEITYDIVGGNGYSHFGIHPKTGVVFVSSPLDYERIREYVLTVRARDGGTPPLASQALINITLSDANDNPPQFSSGSSGYSVQIPEDAPISTSVVQIIANDVDSGLNAKISYHIGTGDRMKHFKIDQNNGIISVASNLDREMIPAYSLVIWAQDMGVPVLSSSTTVEIVLNDVNDNPPLLKLPQEEIIVQEDRSVGHTVYTFEVSDEDASPNSGPFSWDLRDAERPLGSSSVPFTITEGGELNLAGKLNSQRKNLYKLQVRVFDNGDPPLYSDVNITVKVVEKSQWPPVVSPLTVTAITADVSFPPGIPLGKILASDFDVYDVLRYSLIDTPSSTHFTIDPSNGTIKSLTPLMPGTYELGITVSDGIWSARGDCNLRIVALPNIIPDVKFDLDHVGVVTEKDSGSGWLSTSLRKSRKDIGSFAVVITLKGHNPQSLLTRIFALINSVKEAMGMEPGGASTFEVIVLSVQSANSESSTTNSKPRAKREETSDSSESDVEMDMDTIQSDGGAVPSVDILLSVRKADKSFVSPPELVKKLKFALPQIESVLGAKVTRLTYDICKENSCERGQCRTVVTFEGTQSLISTETLSLITPNHLLEVFCFCPPGFGGTRCERVINACAHSECMAGYVCVPDASPKGYACLCRKIYCPPGMPCEEDDHCAQQSVSFRSGQSFLAYNVGPSLERELSISVKVKTMYTSGTLMHSFGHFDFALLEIRQGLVQFSWDLGTGKEVLTVTSISVSDNRWHRITLHLRDNYAILRVDERSTQRQRSPGPARSLHSGGIIYIGAKIIGLHGSTLESLIPAQGFIGCMKDLRYGYFHNTPGGGTDLHIQEVKHYITPGINHIDFDPLEPNKGLEFDEADEVDDAYDHDKLHNKSGGRMAPLPLHSSDSDKLGSHLLWSRNISFSCERILHVVEACRSQPCLNGGLCSENRSGSGATGYQCDCPSRFHGPHCEVDLDPCGSQPCMFGGKCVAAPANGMGVSFSPSLATGGEWLEPQYFCQCPSGTFGLRCERGRWCKNLENDNLDVLRLSDVGYGDEVCRNHGECEDGPSSPICWCTGGYTGSTCQLDVNECERGDACGPGATCVNFPGGFNCTCPANATGLRCNRPLATPSIVVSSYQDLILIVVVIVVACIIFVITFVLIRRCCISREHERGAQLSNAIPLTSHRGLKDGHNGHKDNRERDTSNREQQHLLRNRDSKISNLEVRPVSAGSDIFASELEDSKPTFINNLMKGSSVPKRDKGCSTQWDPNRDDYESKIQNYMKGDVNWAPRTVSQPGSPTSEYHWDHNGDLTHPQPANISPMNTLPPPPNDIPESLSRISTTAASALPLSSINNLDMGTNHGGPTFNLAALPPPDNPHDPLPMPYFDGGIEGTNLDSIDVDPSTWQILHPDQYLLPHTHAEELIDGEDAGVCSCPQLLPQSDNQQTPTPIAIRNRYKDKSSKKDASTKSPKGLLQDEDGVSENSSLLSSGGHSSTTSSKSKIPRRQQNSSKGSSHNVTQV